MDIVQNFAVQIDILRIGKGMTVADLCFDICDESSYRRYKTGKRELPISKLKLFCDRLGIGLDEFLYNMLSKSSYEYKKVHDLFIALQKKQFDVIKKSLPQVRVEEISLDKNIELFEFIVSTYNYYLKKISKAEYVTQLREIQKISDGYYTFNDVIILDKLAWIEVETNRRQALDELNKILLDTKKLYNIYNFHSVIATIFANVANMYTKLNEFDLALTICNKGIRYSKQYNVLKNLHYLYYIKAYIYFHSDSKNDAFKNLSIVVSYIYSMQNEEELKYFVNLIKTEFKINDSAILGLLSESIKNTIQPTA